MNWTIMLVFEFTVKCLDFIIDKVCVKGMFSNESQVFMKYLVAFSFHYHKSIWWIVRHELCLNVAVSSSLNFVCNAKIFFIFLSNFSSLKNQMTLKCTLRKFSESVFNCCHNILQMASSRHKINHNLWTQKGLCHGRCNDKIYSKILITKHIENKLNDVTYTGHGEAGEVTDHGCDEDEEVSLFLVDTEAAATTVLASHRNGCQLAGARVESRRAGTAALSLVRGCLSCDVIGQLVGL